jgi:hypothetical protein
MNWGKGIAIVIVAFMVMMLTLVYKTTQQDFDLVTENYYEASLNHDEIQMQRSNYNSLSEKVTVLNNAETKTLSLKLPAGFDAQPLNGTLQMYRPTDGDADQTLEFTTTDIQISTASLIEGFWRIRLDWKAGEKAYLFESSTFIKN